MSAGITMAGLASGLAIAGGINSLTGGGITSALGLGGGSTATGGTAGVNTATQTAADPFAPYRGQLAAQYAGALAPGGTTDITQMPGYSQYQTGVIDPALAANQRTAGAGGMLYSGNEALQLQKTGQQGYSSFMSDYLNRLATGSGAASNPLGGAQAGMTTAASAQQGVSQGIGALSTSISSLASQFGGGGGSVSPTVATSMGQTGMGQINPASGEYMGSLEF